MKAVLWYILPVVAAVLAAVAVWVDGKAWRSFRVWHGLRTLPVTAPSEVVPEGQPVKVRGRVRAVEGGTGAPLRSLFRKQPCFYAVYLVEWQATDSKGRRSWKEYSREVAGVPFVIEDAATATGVLVDPRSASDLVAKETARETDGKQRHTEWTIGPGMEVFAYGRAARPENPAARAVLEPDARGVLILSANGEAPAAHDYRLGMVGWALCGALSLALAARFFIPRLRPPRI